MLWVLERSVECPEPVFSIVGIFHLWFMNQMSEGFIHIFAVLLHTQFPCSALVGSSCSIHSGIP